MPLKLTLRPGERIVINGAVISNPHRRQVLSVENRSDVIREPDILDWEDAKTPVAHCYYLIQWALIERDKREELLPRIQSELAELASVFSGETRSALMNAANHVSAGDYYKALVALRIVRRREATLLSGGEPDTTEAMS